MTAISAESRMRVAWLAAGGLWRKLRRAFRLLPFHLGRMSGRVPDRLLVIPVDLRMGDPAVAEAIYHGRFPLAGHEVNARGHSPFTLDVAHPAWQRELHGFGWLRHASAADSPLASANARALVRDWIESAGRRIEGPGWQPEVVAARLFAWLGHSAAVLKGADLPFFRLFLHSITWQFAILRTMARDMPPGASRLRARAALALGSLALASSNATARHATRRLSDEIERQILPDGGHVSRNPEALVVLLNDLLPLLHCYALRTEPEPPTLRRSVLRMSDMLRFLRDGDGALARFNGTGTTAHEHVTALLRQTAGGNAQRAHAEASGYVRLALGRSVLLADVGTPPPVQMAGEAHAGTLSFEFSAGGRPLIVNSGIDREGAADFRPLARATAAHSTLVLNDASSARFARGEGGMALVDGPRDVPFSFHENDSMEGFIASHDGYLSRFGLVHQREIRLDRTGNHLWGCDRLLARPGARGPDVAVLRFHLHPDVELLQDERRRPVLRSGREVWLFEGQTAALGVEESLFFAATGGARRTRQITLSFRGLVQPEIWWELRKLDT